MSVALPSTDAPRRVVHQAEALTWLGEHDAEPGYSVFTSLPDVSELPELGFEGWREWFIAAALQVIRWVPQQGVSIFYQSDIRRNGAWVDKGYLVQRAAEIAGAELVFHKIICRNPPGTISHGRASYSHLLCLTRGPVTSEAKPAISRRPGPDVLADAGRMVWSRAMGTEACRLVCRFLRENTTTTTVVDPFCGRGTALAMANAFGFDALGVDRSARCCRAARRLVLE